MVYGHVGQGYINYRLIFDRPRRIDVSDVPFANERTSNCMGGSGAV